MILTSHKINSKMKIKILIVRPLTAYFNLENKQSCIKKYRIIQTPLMSLRAPKHFKTGKHIFKHSIIRYTEEHTFNKFSYNIFCHNDWSIFLACLPTVNKIPEKFIRSVCVEIPIKIHFN